MAKAKTALECGDRDDYVAAKIKTDPRNHRYKVGCLNEFLGFCDTNVGHYELGKLTKRHIKDFADHLASRFGAPASKAAKLRLIFSWFEWLEAERRIAKNPCQGLKANELLAKKEL